MIILLTNIHLIAIVCRMHKHPGQFQDNSLESLKRIYETRDSLPKRTSIIRRAVASLALGGAVFGSLYAFQETKPEARTACTVPVFKGDTIWDLAKGNLDLVDDIVAANNDKAEIFAGDRINLGKSACAQLAKNGVDLLPYNATQIVAPETTLATPQTAVTLSGAANNNPQTAVTLLTTAVTLQR